jgi:hypothetical protein
MIPETSPDAGASSDFRCQEYYLVFLSSIYDGIYETEIGKQISDRVKRSYVGSEAGTVKTRT